MISLLDIAERTQKGPKMEEKAWNMGLFRKCAEIARRFDIRCDDDGTWFNTDDALADRAFEAGVAFLSEVGMYCISTGRVVRFSREEVLEACREAQPRVIVGTGRDARTITKKQIETKERLNQCPGHHAPFSEEYAPLVIKDTARLPEGDYMEGINFTQTDGREVFGLPTEAYAARRELFWMRDGVCRAGRPGMAVALYPISTRAAALIAPMDPDYGLRRTDGVLLSTLPDMKMEQDLLTAAIVYRDYGAFAVNGGGGESVGGFCGDVEGALVASVAKPIAGFLVYRHAWCYTGGVGRLTNSTLKTVGTNRRMSRARSVVCQALSRHANIIGFTGAGWVCGPGSETYLREIATGSIAAPINGLNMTSSRHHRAMMNAGQTPFEAEWMAEVARATQRAGLTRAGADEVMDKFAPTLNGKPAEPGQHIDQCYDLVRGRIKPEWEAKYLRVKGELAALGLQFD
ncbi:MAG: monomethylamine:corrinoid methyltransferase [Chloroflexi bacterium]|nr:monomethylamine:corrinoid methyltransferase [Chloroflexota bacterium]